MTQFFPPRVKGEPWTPDINFENALRKLINSQSAFNDITGLNQFSLNTVSVWNTSTSVSILPGEAISISSTHEKSGTALPVVAYHSSDTQFLIAKNKIEPGKIGTAVVFGIVEVELKNDVGTDPFAVPCDDTGHFTTYECAPSGSAKILFKYYKTIEKISVPFALVLLLAPSSSLHGMFSMRRVKVGDVFKIKVFNSDPNTNFNPGSGSPVAGIVVPGGYIDEALLSMHGTTTYVYLETTFTSDGLVASQSVESYASVQTTTYFTHSLTSNVYRILLGTVSSDGNVTYATDGNKIYLGDFFYYAW